MILIITSTRPAYNEFITWKLLYIYSYGYMETDDDDVFIAQCTVCSVGGKRWFIRPLNGTEKGGRKNGVDERRDEIL